MATVEFKGIQLKKYLGKDGESTLTLFPGMRVDVSDGKADQLIKDYPEDFVKTSSSATSDLAEPEQKQTEKKSAWGKGKK